MDIWYYAANGGQQGPVSQAVLGQLIASGQLPPDSLVWREGMTNWLPVRSVPDLASILPAGPYVAQQQQQMLGYGGGVPTYGAEVAYAGFWLRFCAAFVDGLIIGLPFFIVGKVLFPTQPFTPGQPPNVSALGGACFFNIIQIVAIWLYSAKLESSEKMATLGKQALGLKVTDEFGQRISFGRASGRHFGKLVSWLTLLIGFIMAGFTAKKQALHDIMAGTLVVKK